MVAVDLEKQAETIAKNVRKKIIKEHLNEPAFYDKMSALLKEILDDLKAKRINYEKFLKQVAEQIIKPLQRGTDNGMPAELDSPGKIAIYRHLSDREKTLKAGQEEAITKVELAIKIDRAVKGARQDDWRGNVAKETLIKKAVYNLVDRDDDELEKIFPIIVAQKEY